jgi:hypothetical protein
MSTDRETTRVVRSWLDEGVTKLPDRVLDAVLDQVPATPQRRSGWSAWRSVRMNTYAKLAAAAAAVLVVAVIGYRFLPAANVGGQPSPSPTTAPAATAPIGSAAPTGRPAPFPSAGPLGLGRHQFTLENVSFTVEIATPGWSGDGEVFIGKGTEGEPTGSSVLFWPEDPEFVYVDSCGEKAAAPVGPDAADIAAAIAGMSQLELVSGPTSMTLDGNPAQHVVVRVPDQIPCAANDFYLWGNSTVSRYATTADSTYWVWIIDVDDTRIQIDAESYAGAAPNVGEELKAIVESIRFE